MPNVKKIRGLNLPGTPWATSACCGMNFTFSLNPVQILMVCFHYTHYKKQSIIWCLRTNKGKGLPQQAEVAQEIPGRLRPRIFMKFVTTRVVGRQPYAPTTFTPGEIPGTHFKRLSRPQSTRFCRGESRKKSPVTPPGIDPGTIRLVAQCLNP